MADYNDLSNPKKGWPPGTTGVREWHFTGTYSDGRKNIPVFEMLYADYAGGYLSDTDISHKDLDFDAPTGSVLMLLDGHKLQRSLSGSSPQSTQELVEDLRDMLPIAMKKIEVPMHFVVTKWDLLEPEYSIRDVRNHLVAHSDDFQSFVSMMNKSGVPLHLIPVSAVGMEFAEIDGTGNIVKKKNAPSPKPFQVELPICLTVTDAFTKALKSLPPPESSCLSSICRFAAGAFDQRGP